TRFNPGLISGTWIIEVFFLIQQIKVYLVSGPQSTMLATHTHTYTHYSRRMVISASLFKIELN
uniref:Uncharacterized protein n=1 Tax=Oryza brachyantha TaxID=4533 RepID=J3KXQ3_ORYBR